MHSFFAYLHRLRFIHRWSLMRSTMPENVAEHSYDVAILTHALCTISRTCLGREIDTGRAVTLALFHDAAEVMTGDIATPVKYHNPQILASLKTMEVVAGERLVSMLPESLRLEYHPLLFPSHDDPTLAIVKAADKLSAYLKCATEVAAGNREFTIAKQQLAAGIEALHMPEITLFLDQFGIPFERTLDEIAGSE